MLAPVAAPPSSRQRTAALYISVRAIQSLYNAAKARGWWHFWGSHWEHGDTLLFAITSAQVMYAYVMRPDTLPPAYNNFIVNTGPISRVMLQATRDRVRGVPVDAAAVSRYCVQANPAWYAQWVDNAVPDWLPSMVAALQSRLKGARPAP